ncbi:MAG: tripartite tricarboxylate transporter substrate binding protein [Betaproteobacteria bacterium]|nr:tripartite tricarboxylate transporter substrate binding protein [Betaproteobacteria bacterium]
MKLVVRAITAVIFVAFCLQTAAFGQSYPSKPVRVIIPHAAGGPNDIAGRIVFQRMSELLGQQFVIETRPGAGSTIGTAAVAKSPPDGYTIMVHSTTHIASAHLYKKLPYDTLKDFIGVTPIAAQVGILGVHPALPVKSVKDLISLARTRPNDVAYASAGSGSYVHLAMSLFNSMAGIQMTHVPYKGSGPAGVGLAAGEVQVMVATYALFSPFIARRQVRLLGVTSDTRIKLLPELPTIAEAGLSGYEFAAWVGVLTPAGVARPIIDTLHGALKKALADPDVEKRLMDLALDPMFMSPEEFARRLRSDFDKYAKVVPQSGATVE